MAALIEEQLPLVVIVGPTASGKTGLAVRIARDFNGEVISADSRAIYRGLSIGTAKPSVEEQQGVPHWGIDLVDPGDRFTAADFKAYALKRIDEIRSRGHVPIIAGGTGLYIDAVLYDFQFPDDANNTARRDELMLKSIEDLHRYCEENNIKLPENTKNKRHVVNKILRNGTQPQRKHKLDDNVVVVGIATEKKILRQRIEERAGVIVGRRSIDEAVEMAKSYGWTNEAMTGNIYPLVHQYIIGEITKEELMERFIAKDWQLAKRQLTWFKRNEHINWLGLDAAYSFIARELEKVNKP